MLLIIYFLVFMGAIYPAGAFLVWLLKYRKTVSLKKFWGNV